MTATFSRAWADFQSEKEVFRLTATFSRKIGGFSPKPTDFEERSIHLWRTIFSPLTPERPINTGSSRLRNQVILSSLLHQGKIRRSNRPKNKKNGLSWSTLPPLAPERPINTGGSRLRNQVILSGLLHQGKFYAWNFSKQLFRYFQIACICPKNGDFEGV